MKTVFVWTTLAFANDQADALCASARQAAIRGEWKVAENAYFSALLACAQCSPEAKLILRSELANVLVHGGSPEAAAAQWRRAMLEIEGLDPRLKAVAESGLAVALYTGGHKAEANRYWGRACVRLEGLNPEHAACRFNAAVARMESENVWSELEELLPSMLTVDSPATRTTARLQTARAAAVAGAHGRAKTLAEQAGAELASDHPLMDTVYGVKAEIAEARGASKEAKVWRKKVRAGINTGRVSADQWRRKPQ
ncbi:MAG: hypothetical protein FJW30_07420 [Acidobacteria bacterium]|nr:hypothetical protein [Acidobacteriota bacterium]